MQTLRHAHLHARLVLAWFVLSLGVAVASPLVRTQGFTIVCSDMGAIKLLANSDDGDAPWVAHTLDCPLCAQLLAPPLPAHRHWVPNVVPSALPQNIPAASVEDHRVVPFHARAPPTPTSFGQLLFS